MRLRWTQTATGLPLIALALAAVVACESDLASASGANALVTDAGGDGALAQCIGPTPPAAAWKTKPAPEGVAGLTAPVLGSQAPDFALPDFQPQSCGFGATYGLAPYRGKVTFVALLAGW